MIKETQSNFGATNVAVLRKQLSLASRTYYGTLLAASAAIVLVETTDLKYSSAWFALPISLGVIWLASAFWFAWAIWRSVPNLVDAATCAVATVVGGPIAAMITSAKADLALDKLEGK